MKMVGTKEAVRKELKRLLRAMDFVSENLLEKQRKRATQQVYFDIYQGLGLAWEFLGLRCRHWDGFKRTKGSKKTCRICGAVLLFEKSGKGSADAWASLSARTSDYRSSRKKKIGFEQDDRKHPDDPEKKEA